MLGNITLELFVSGIPKFLNDVLSEFFKKSNRVITNPFTGLSVEQAPVSSKTLTFSKVTFSKSSGYSLNKTKKKGKVKRKIRKRIFATNNVID